MNNTTKIKDASWWQEYNQKRKDYIKKKNDERATKKRINTTNTTKKNTTKTDNPINLPDFNRLLTEIQELKALVQKGFSQQKEQKELSRKRHAEVSRNYY